MLKYHSRQLRKDAPKRTNKKPEKVVEKLVMSWLNARGFSVNVIEAKATYSRAAGRYLSGQTDAGVSDIVGNDRYGCGVFIELKAPGKRATLRPAQSQFLKEKIRTNCFAVCVDSVDLLERLYRNWSSVDGVDSQKYLMNELPKQRNK